VRKIDWINKNNKNQQYCVEYYAQNLLFCICILVLKRCGLLKERSILIDFRGKNRGFDFNFFWLPKYQQYAGLTEKMLTVAFSPVHTCNKSPISAVIVADFGHYSHQKWQL